MLPPVITFSVPSANKAVSCLALTLNIKILVSLLQLLSLPQLLLRAFSLSLCGSTAPRNGFCFFSLQLEDQVNDPFVTRPISVPLYLLFFSYPPRTHCLSFIVLTSLEVFKWFVISLDSALDFLYVPSNYEILKMWTMIRIMRYMGSYNRLGKKVVFIPVLRVSNFSFPI